MLGIVDAIRKGAWFFSFFIGLGISALLFHRDFQVLKTPAMPLPEMTNKVIKANGKCYRYRVEDANCESLSSR
jgi:hypothetical protein